MGGLQKAGEKRVGGGSSKKGTEGEKGKKNAFKSFAIENAKEKGVGAGKA